LLKKSVIPIVFSLSILILLIPAPNANAGPGSTTVFMTDFEAGLPGEFGGAGAVEDTALYSGFFYDNFYLRNISGGNPDGTPSDKTTLTLSNLECHTNVSIQFSLAAIDSWDGTTNAGGTVSPDFFNVDVDGNNVYMETFDFIDEADQTGPTVFPAQLSYGSNLAGAGQFTDGAYDLSNEADLLGIPHDSDTLTVDWYASGNGWQGGNCQGCNIAEDESWAIDNVEVILTGIDDPSCVTRIGGEFLPIQTTSLILAGAQTFSWMIPVVLSVLGIGLFVVTRKKEC